jgi:hypothetical protein
MKEKPFDWADVFALGMHPDLTVPQLLRCLPGSVGNIWRRQTAAILRRVAARERKAVKAGKP